MDIVELIQRVYGNFNPDTRTLNVWFAILKDCDKKDVEQRFFDYAKFGQYPPKPSDLINVAEETPRIAPNAEETAAYYKKYEDIVPASREVANRYLAEMRKILGIKRG